jgi:ABC-type bacteriocin/lantibiotic exporter with double-glycine peptidase domain
MISIYVLLKNLSLEDKIYVIIYARNTSYLFTLLKNIIENIDQINKNSKCLNKIYGSQKRKDYDEIVLEPNFELKIKSMKYMNNSLNNEIIISNKDKIILHGESGSGKTTILKIMKGLWEPSEMSLEYNGKCIPKNFHQLQKNIMFVQSDTFLFFNETLYNFIVEDYQFDIDLLDFLMEITELNMIFDDIFNTIINNQTISSGQMRRLTIVKAFYHFHKGNYKILLLDEVDNGIHSELFVKILKKIFKSTYFINKAIILITHNSTIQESNLFNHSIYISKGIVYFK